MPDPVRCREQGGGFPKLGGTFLGIPILRIILIYIEVLCFGKLPGQGFGLKLQKPGSRVV